jgi:hypothetical protein
MLGTERTLPTHPHSGFYFSSLVQPAVIHNTYYTILLIILPTGTFNGVTQSAQLYRIVIRPIVTYASETWVLKGAIIQKLLVFERKILRRIFGPTSENQIWRIKTNEELDKLIKHKNIINHIKTQRLSWFGHVQRMPDTRTVTKIFNWKPLTKRS